jgi:hypothetical protein
MAALADRYCIEHELGRGDPVLAARLGERYCATFKPAVNPMCGGRACRRSGRGVASWKVGNAV